jgi:hypothetical protein
MTLQEKLTAMKEESLAKMPPEVSSILKEETANLVNSGVADNAIKPGERLPEFSLPDENGNIVSSNELLAKGPLAVCFYRGVW